MNAEERFNYNELKKEIEYFRLDFAEKFKQFNDNLIEQKNETCRGFEKRDELNERRFNAYMEAVKVVKTDVNAKASRAMVMAIFALMSSVFSGYVAYQTRQQENFRDEVLTENRQTRSEIRAMAIELTEIKGEIKSLHALDNFLKQSELIFEK